MICEISTSLIQPLLTIVGWAVMILWAIKQIKLSSTTNLSIQKELLEENHRRELVKEIIHIYKDLVISLEDLLQAGNIFSLHLNLENANIKSNVSITASGLSEPINIAYKEVSRDFNRLDMWLKVSPSIPNVMAIQLVISEFSNNFTLSKNADEKPIWLAFQSTLSLYLAKGLNKPENLINHWCEVSSNIESIKNNLVSSVSDVNNELLNMYNKSN